MANSTVSKANLKANLKPEIRFRVSEELLATIQEIQALGDFDSIGAAARFVIKLQSKAVLAYLSQAESGSASLEPPKVSSSAKPLGFPPPDSPIIPDPQKISGGFAQQFASLKQKIN
ncbi:MAG: hypothetical protein HC825_00500 [Oscillatoriales cyanobacterium RM1_1_9]|nr:hypothetical protein [Oscillatoriales cyanobacterium SM2_3_0]NJO45085.1 hypothetical protein [Oscillatoriales cyanobacterium RM2_1_1]NJO70592.1 hypothetical protein [Oscillatoriales cyanobacterium RM1_1_9]